MTDREKQVRERAEKLYFWLSLSGNSEAEKISRLESFAHEIIEDCAKAAEDTSALIVEPGNRFDAGYSQGRHEAGLRVRALKEAI